MTEGMNPLRFYRTPAWVYDTFSEKCTYETVGLVGLHIVTKTPTRPQWIWSTFEQIDNIPQTGAQPPYTYNNASGTKMPDKNPITKPTGESCEGLPPDKCPFNVTRLHPIDPSTMETNRKYQLMLRGILKSNVWQYYQLVMTQWPTPKETKKNGKPENTIPGNIPVPFKGPMTSFANVTMETFEQADIKSGCMNCHNSTASDSGASTDFNWAVAMNAWSPGQPQLGTASVLRLDELAKVKPQSPAIKKLIAILTQAHKDMAASPKTAKTPAKKPAKPKAKPNPSE